MGHLPVVEVALYKISGDFSTIAGDLRMTELGPSLKIKEKSLLLRRAMP
jgi:hypothetical protein